MRLVAEMRLAVLDREARVGIARVDLAFLLRRPLHRRRNDRRVDQRAALDDQPARVELAVDLGQKLFRQAQLVDALAKAPDRGVVRRLFVERNAAEAPERQPVAHGFLGAGVGQAVPLLEKSNLEHGERRVRRCAVGRTVQRPKQDVEGAPLERLGDLFEKPAAPRMGPHESVRE